MQKWRKGIVSFLVKPASAVLQLAPINFPYISCFLEYDPCYMNKTKILMRYNLNIWRSVASYGSDSPGREFLPKCGNLYLILQLFLPKCVPCTLKTLTFDLGIFLESCGTPCFSLIKWFLAIFEVRIKPPCDHTFTAGPDFMCPSSLALNSDDF